MLVMILGLRTNTSLKLDMAIIALSILMPIFTPNSLHAMTQNGIAKVTIIHSKAIVKTQEIGIDNIEENKIITIDSQNGFKCKNAAGCLKLNDGVISIKGNSRKNVNITYTDAVISNSKDKINVSISNNLYVDLEKDLLQIVIKVELENKNIIKNSSYSTENENGKPYLVVVNH
jgi:hypothetical protein